MTETGRVAKVQSRTLVQTLNWQTELQGLGSIWFMFFGPQLGPVLGSCLDLVWGTGPELVQTMSVSFEEYLD